MDDIKRKLIELLREIYDNRDFVGGTMSNCGSEEAWEKMYEFITDANKRGKKLTSDEILLLSLELGEDKGRKSGLPFGYKGTVVASL